MSGDQKRLIIVIGVRKYWLFYLELDLVSPLIFLLSFPRRPSCPHPKESRAFSLLPLTVHPANACMTGAPPCLLPRLPHSKSSPSRQYSLVMPSLAPDKTPARLRHNLRPPDRVACNANIFHKGGKKMDSDIPHLSLTFCHRALLPVCIFCVQTFGLVCERFLSNFRNHPLALVANVLPQPACDYLHYVHGLHSWCI